MSRSQFSGVTCAVRSHAGTRIMKFQLGRNVQIKSGLTEGDHVSLTMKDGNAWLRKSNTGNKLICLNNYRLSGSSTLFVEFGVGTIIKTEKIEAEPCNYATGKGFLRVVLPKQLHSAASLPLDTQRERAAPPAAPVSRNGECGTSCPNSAAEALQ